MIPAPTYASFLATINPDDLALLTVFITGVDAQALNATDAAVLIAQSQRLYDAGLLTKWNSSRNNSDEATILPYAVSALVSPIAAGYVGQLARERVTLSRNPLP